MGREFITSEGIALPRPIAMDQARTLDDVLGVYAADAFGFPCRARPVMIAGAQDEDEKAYWGTESALPDDCWFDLRHVGGPRSVKASVVPRADAVRALNACMVSQWEHDISFRVIAHEATGRSLIVTSCLNNPIADHVWLAYVDTDSVLAAVDALTLQPA